MAAYPSEGNALQSEEQTKLMEWWNAVEGWSEWKRSNFQKDDEEMAVEQAADRVFKATRLFVRLFNQREASLQQRIQELFVQADKLDKFHKKTVSAALGGRGAELAGHMINTTGFALAPFTFGISTIISAVGIGVASVGGLITKTANITDKLRCEKKKKKMETMIQGYQEEIKDIKECWEFVQEGMDTLQGSDFEKNSESAFPVEGAVEDTVEGPVDAGTGIMSARSLRRNIFCLAKNAPKLLKGVERAVEGPLEGIVEGPLEGAVDGPLEGAVEGLLEGIVKSPLGGAVEGVVKGPLQGAVEGPLDAGKGIMSALSLPMNIFHLAKNAHQLRKGSKTKLACTIREVCKDFQDDLLELKKMKTQLQKTMDQKLDQAVQFMKGKGKGETKVESKSVKRKKEEEMESQTKTKKRKCE